MSRKASRDDMVVFRPLMTFDRNDPADSQVLEILDSVPLQMKTALMHFVLQQAVTGNGFDLQDVLAKAITLKIRRSMPTGSLPALAKCRVNAAVPTKAAQQTKPLKEVVLVPAPSELVACINEPPVAAADTHEDTPPIAMVASGSEDLSRFRSEALLGNASW